MPVPSTARRVRLSGPERTEALRHLVFLVLIVLAAALEASVPRALLLVELRPMFIVPFVFYFALRLNTVEGALLSLVAGVAQEAASGLPAGRSAFALVLLFVATRLVLAGLRGDGRVFETLACGGFALAFHVLTLGLSRWFEPAWAPLSDQPWLSASLWGALATLIVAAPLLSLARRVDQIGARPSEIL